MAKSVLKDTITALHETEGLKALDTGDGELKKLTNDLSNIDYADLPLHSPEVRTWLKRVLDVINDLHELVEKPAAVDRGVSSKVRHFLKLASRSSEPTEKIRKTLEDVINHKPMSREKKSNVNVKEGAWTGREAEEKKITEQLSETNDPIILPIVGIRGLGKTRLASCVYNKLELYKIWVDIPEAFRVESTVDSIIKYKQLDPENTKEALAELDGSSDDDQLRVRLLKKIEGRYVLVLNGLNTVDQVDWDRFKKILPSGGSILITTRSAWVARITGTVPPFALQGLSEDHSWSLFKNITSSSGKSDSTNEDIQRKMVEKCKGVPLAIHILGSQESTSPASETNIESMMEKKFLEELERTYCSELPFPLNLCFAFCSIFPNNEVIDVPRLMDLWIGERFILPRFSSHKSLVYEDAGEEYFLELYERSIFQDVQEDELGHQIPTSCRMHPLMNYLAVSVAKDDYISVRPDGKGLKDSVLHASFDFSLDVSSVIPESLSDKLLTIFLPAAKQSRLPNVTKMSYSTCKMIFTKFKSLQVLDLHDLGMKSVPSNIDNLGQLRYLDLSRNNMEMLPSSITNLEHLQTLRLSHCHELKDLPKDLDELTRLRHLDLEGCLGLTHMPECVKKMTSLRSLSLFMSGNRKSTSSGGNTGGLGGLATLNELRGVLEIAHLERCVALDAKEAKLKEKHRLQRLVLRWDHDNHNDDVKDAKGDLLNDLEPPKDLKALLLMGYGGKTLSHWQSSVSSLQCLVKFSLINCSNCQSLLPLHHLQSLQILELRKLNSLKFIVDNSDESGATASSGTDKYFPSLKKLIISDCPMLASWWKKEIVEGSIIPSFSSISILDIQYCPKLKCMPKELLGKLSSMQRLHIRECHLLQSLPQGFRNLVSLEDLIIENCKELDLMKDSSDEEWKDLKKLRSLTIRGIPKLERLPKGLDCVTTLQELHLHDCSKLTCLLDNMEKLIHLETLEISECSNLASLPQGLKSTSLHTLIIKDCPKLVPRCQPNTGDHWPQIQNIRNRSIW